MIRALQSDNIIHGNKELIILNINKSGAARQ